MFECYHFKVKMKLRCKLHKCCTVLEFQMFKDQKDRFSLTSNFKCYILKCLNCHCKTNIIRTISVLPLTPKETLGKCLALVALVVLIRVQNLFLKEHFLKMSAVELFLKLSFHVMVQHIEM